MIFATWFDLFRVLPYSDISSLTCSPFVSCTFLYYTINAGITLHVCSCHYFKVFTWCEPTDSGYVHQFSANISAQCLSDVCFQLLFWLLFSYEWVLASGSFCLLKSCVGSVEAWETTEWVQQLYLVNTVKDFILGVQPWPRLRNLLSFIFFSVVLAVLTTYWISVLTDACFAWAPQRFENTLHCTVCWKTIPAQEPFQYMFVFLILRRKPAILLFHRKAITCTLGTMTHLIFVFGCCFWSHEVVWFTNFQHLKRVKKIIYPLLRPNLHFAFLPNKIKWGN